MEDNKKSNEDIETSENNEELEETQDESQEEESNESEESQEETDDDSDEESPSLEDYNKVQAELKEFKEKNKQLFARLKKTEQKPLQKKEGITEEQLIRVAKVASSLDDDDLEVLGTITGNSIADKMDNPLFKAYKEQKEKKKRSEASALKPSSPNTFSGKKDPNNPNLTEDEHKELVEKMMKG